jgi:hypothetical protein
MRLDKSKLDVAQIFLTFMSLIGDVEKTATALDLDPKIVAALADQEGWIDKVRRLSVMSKSGKQGDHERATNRALNFVQAHRMRMTVDALLRSFDGLTPEEICEKLSTVDKNGNYHISARFLADLAAASEKIQALSYAALGDSVKERVERAEADDGEMTPDQLHAAVIAALNAPHAPAVASQVLEAEVRLIVAPSENPSTSPAETEVSKKSHSGQKEP